MTKMTDSDLKYMSRHGCNFGPTYMADISVQGVSDTHFGQYYKSLNMTSAIHAIEIVWAEVTATLKCKNHENL